MSIKRLTAEEKAFRQGFAAALGTLCREYDEPTMAVDVAICNGLTIEDFRKAKVDGFDLRPLSKAFRGSSR